ncbi:MAG: AbrB/MazE/SpoVT family DNA-binding domain-containing protein [Rhodospirillales bacterium]|jgi:putative addiction module antidote
MSSKTTLRKIGNSLGIILPRPLLDQFGFSEGSEIQVIVTPEGLLLSHADPLVAEAMKATHDFMRRYRKTLAELAKS